MATKNFVPRATGEGQLGTDSKKWDKHIAISGAYSYVSASSKGSFGSLFVGGNSELAGNLTLGGNITIGDADTDSLVITADLSSSLIPDADSTYNIGSTSKNWKYGYIEELASTNITASNNISASGNITLGGNISGSITSTGSFGYVKVPDDGELSIGTSDDLRIYHNGSHSFIQDSGTGNLILRTSTFQVKNAANDETMIQANEDGAVTLFHNNNQRLVSTAGGVNMTGNITASGHISASGTVFASKFESAGASGETISFNDNLNITGNITASGNISASGDIRADGRIFEQGTSVIDHATAMAIVFGG